jgi:hypothetical protein
MTLGTRLGIAIIWTLIACASMLLTWDITSLTNIVIGWGIGVVLCLFFGSEQDNGQEQS